MFHLCCSSASAISTLNLYFRIDEYDVSLSALRISLQNCAEHMFYKRSTYAVNALIILEKN